MAQVTRIDKLTDSNYLTWSRKIAALLVERDLAAALSTESAGDINLHAKAVALITLSVSDHLLHLVDPVAKTYDVLNKFKAYYAGKHTVRLVQLRRELANARMQPKETVAAYYARIINIRDRLALCNHAVDDADLKLAILAGLSDQYNVVVESIAHTQITLDDLLARLEGTEQRMNKTGKSPGWESNPAVPAKPGPDMGHSQALYAANGSNRRQNAPRPPPGPCPRCHDEGHWASDCPMRTQSQKKKSQCWVCGEHGHISRECKHKNTGHKSDADEGAIYSAVALAAAADDNDSCTDNHGCPFDSYADYCEQYGLLLAEETQEAWEEKEQNILTAFKASVAAEQKTIHSITSCPPGESNPSHTTVGFAKYIQQGMRALMHVLFASRHLCLCSTSVFIHVLLVLFSTVLVGGACALSMQHSKHMQHVALVALTHGILSALGVAAVSAWIHLCKSDPHQHLWHQCDSHTNLGSSYSNLALSSSHAMQYNTFGIKDITHTHTMAPRHHGITTATPSCHCTASACHL